MCLLQLQEHQLLILTSENGSRPRENVDDKSYSKQALYSANQNDVFPKVKHHKKQLSKTKFCVARKLLQKRKTSRRQRPIILNIVQEIASHPASSRLI